jgi:hypothetical protein
MVIRKVGAISAGKVMGILNAVVGLLIGVVFALIGMLGLIVQAGNGGDANPMGFLFGIGAIVMMPVFYGLMGFVTGAIGALIYNVVAAVVGGIELTVDTGEPA